MHVSTQATAMYSAGGKGRQAVPRGRRSDAQGRRIRGCTCRFMRKMTSEVRVERNRAIFLLSAAEKSPRTSLSRAAYLFLVPRIILIFVVSGLGNTMGALFPCVTDDRSRQPLVADGLREALEVGPCPECRDCLR